MLFRVGDKVSYYDPYTRQTVYGEVAECGDRQHDEVWAYWGPDRSYGWMMADKVVLVERAVREPKGYAKFAREVLDKSNI